VNGVRSDQVNYTIDGTDNNDLYLNADAVNQGSISGIAGVIYPIDALDEYSLQTNGKGESGRSPGGNLNVSTKSGTNTLHGSAYYFNRNEGISSNPAQISMRFVCLEYACTSFILRPHRCPWGDCLRRPPVASETSEREWHPDISPPH
jgi:hypothetical protein